MQLPQSVLSSLKKTKKPQCKFITQLLGLRLMLPGHATLRNLSRYSPYHARTFSRWYARDFDWGSLNKAASTTAVPPAHAQAVVLAASFVPTSGTQTYGLDRFWNSSPSRTEKGLAISTLAGLDITSTCAYCLSVEQTPPSADTSNPEATRMAGYLDQLTRVVTAQDLSFLRYVVTAGAYRKQNFVGGVRALGLHQIGKWRADAHLRYLYPGPKRPEPGRHKTYDGKVNWSDLSRFEQLDTEADPIVLYHQVVHHVQFPRNLQVVVVVHTQRNRYAVLFSTDVDLDALKLYSYDKARFQIEVLLRDAKQLSGLSACQARAKAKLEFHFKASLSAGTFAKLEARHQSGNGTQAFSMASLKRRACNQHRSDRICAH